MKYKELLNFEPITEVVKFSRTNEADYQASLVKTFVFSKTLNDNLLPLMVRNLDFNHTGESFGLQVVGNYGTGKSHLMSLVSLVAENADLLALVNDDKAKNTLAPIAGKFNVLRFELGNTESLWEVVTYQMENHLKEVGINFSFDGHGPKSYYAKLQLMMAEFEEKYPNKGFLMVIDEMLAYLKGRSSADKLNQDLAVLQALGQACDKSKFKFIFGVQEMIYHSPEFQFAAEMLQKVNDRYNDIIITKEDVAFIVKQRLLRKDEHQKQEIRNHLDPFLSFYTDMHGRTEEYVELFPVHPSYFENFEKIRIAKSQREILKTLSHQFTRMMDLDIPDDNPGLLTYDRYWEDMQKSQDLMAIPDVRKVKEITETIYDKINSFFTSGRSSQKPTANRIVNACAIKLLQNDLSKQNGTNVERLVDDLCLVNNLATDREFLVDSIGATAQLIIQATSGQYFDKNRNNDEYHLRVEGGINFDQKIKDYVTTMSNSQKDDAFFMFLEKILPLDYNPYRTGFKIWEHDIDWKSHKTYRNGYIFFGNPNERSTTHPRQHFYMYFMPIFDDNKKTRNHEEDEVYFIFESLSDEFKEAVTLFGAAHALQVRADSSQKGIYQQKLIELSKIATDLFDQEYVQITMVDYQGKELPLNGYQLPAAGASRVDIFSTVASTVLEEWFGNECPDYPKFTQLHAPVSKDNFDRLIKQALHKVATPELTNRDGEGILAGLGCWIPGSLDYSHSLYAKSLLHKLKEKGEGKVLNRDEIIEYIDQSDNLWITKDHKIEAELQFVVMATLAALGEIEITLNSGININSTNLNELKEIQKQDFFNFSHIKQPKGLNLAALKQVFTSLLGRDLSNHLKDPSTYTHLVKAATSWADRTVRLLNKLQDGYQFKGIVILTPEQTTKYKVRLTAFSGFCDKIAAYTSEARIKNFPYTVENLNNILPVKQEIEKLEKHFEELEQLGERITYLQQCKQYITDPAFKEEVTNTLRELATVLNENSSQAISAYKKKLEDLTHRYADWYLDLYLKHRISQYDHTRKLALLDSDTKAICDILKEADFLSTGQYSHWLTKMNKLQPADENVNKHAILNAPYQDFNPVEYEGEEILTVKQLELQLEELLSQWTETLKVTLEDPVVVKNMDLLNGDTQTLLTGFRTGATELTKQNAITIRDAILELLRGLEKIEFTSEDLKVSFTKPLTPDEAIEAFKAYVNGITKGKDRNNIRIILK